MVFIKQFPFGCPRAPISYISHHSATTATTEPGIASPGDSIWAPFLSQRDWEIVQWAKDQKITALVFSALLAISGVRAHAFNMYSLYCSANPRHRLSTGWSYHIAL